MIHPVYTDKGGYRQFGTKRSGALFSDKYYHLGYDYNVPKGTTVRAITKGVVVYAGQMSGFGSLFPSTDGGCVIIKHDIADEIYYGVYGHLDNIQVGIGELVVECDYIGNVNGFTSNSVLLPHLHFGLYKNDRCRYRKLGYDTSIDKFIDPIKFLKEKGAKWFK